MTTAATGALIAGEPVSPELALVSPELGAKARAELPDRPWEAFAPPASPIAPVPVVQDPVAPAAPRIEPIVADVRAVAPAIRAPVPAVDAPAPPRPTVAPSAARSDVKAGRRRRVTAGRAVTTLAAALGLGVMVAGSLPIVPDAPVLEAAPPTKAAPIAVGGGGYTAGRLLTFRTNGDGSALLDVTTVNDCGRVTLAGPVPVAADGSFRVRFGTRPVVRVLGRFVSSTSATGIIRATAPGCDSGRVRFRALLS